jgi:hypothetical protein
MRAIRITLAIGLFALGLLCATAAPTTKSSGPINLAPYAPLSHHATTVTGVVFARLTPSELARVRVSATQALDTATHWEPFSGKDPRITVVLGEFADSKNVPSVPAYLVIFDGVLVPNLGPKPAPPSHRNIEVINAVTGHAMEGFSYG